MDKPNISVQAFRVENKKIILENLPQDLYNQINESVPDFYERIDNHAWTMTATDPDTKDIYYLIMSRNPEEVKNFMNAVFFTEEILNK